MAFTENSDPIEDLQIGTIETSIDKKYLKKLSKDELNRIYDRIHDKSCANVLVDGVSYNNLTYYEKIVLNNNIVDTLNYIENIKRRDEARALNLKSGDAIKVTIRGGVYRGCVLFSKRGIVKTDSRGRIVARTQYGGLIKVMRTHITVLKGKEKKDFQEEYKEKYIKSKKLRLERQMELYKNIAFHENYYKKLKKEYEDLINNSPF